MFESTNDPLQVSSLDDLLRHEPELVRRIQEMPNGGLLLMVDPMRLLREVGLECTANALEEWKSVHSAFFQRTGREHTYEAVKHSCPGDERRVTVKGLFKRTQP